MSPKFVLLALVLVLYHYPADGSPESIRAILHKFRTRSAITDAELAELASAPEDDLPAPVKRMVQNLGHGDNTCCRNTPTKVVTKSRQGKRVNTHKTTFRAGSAHCGFWGWSRCATYGARFRDIVTYVTEYYKDTVVGVCPEKDITCCHLFVNVSGRCVNINDLSHVAGNILG